MEKAVLLADDHMAVRIGLHLLCDLHLGVKKIDDACTCSEIMNCLKKKSYSHLILDLTLFEESTLELIPTIRELYPKLQIVVYSMQPEQIYKKTLASYGIDFISKALPEKESIQRLNQFFSRGADNRSFHGAGWIFLILLLISAPLSELEVYHYLIKGVSISKIASTLNVSPSTISTMKVRIFEKCQVDNIIDLKEVSNLNSLAEKQAH